jgi:hypothetical protein
VILLDTTVLSNFALAQAMPLLADFCGSRALATEQVLGELGKGVSQGSMNSFSSRYRVERRFVRSGQVSPRQRREEMPWAEGKRNITADESFWEG